VILHGLGRQAVVHQAHDGRAVLFDEVDTSTVVLSGGTPIRPSSQP